MSPDRFNPPFEDALFSLNEVAAKIIRLQRIPSSSDQAKQSALEVAAVACAIARDAALIVTSLEKSALAPATLSGVETDCARGTVGHELITS